jgi:hypothetical protein
MKTLLTSFFLFCGLAFAGNACVSTNAVTTASNVNTTWQHCGNASSISFDAAAAGPYEGSGTSTWTHTVGSGSNGVLIVAVSSHTSTTDSVTGVTYGGTALTQLYKHHGTTSWLYFYILYNPPSGSASVVVSSSAQILPASASYFGVKQSGQPDATGNGTGFLGNPNATLTTVSDNTWVLGYFWSQVGNSAGTGNVQRAYPSSLAGLYDSNSAVWPHGAYTMTVGGSASFVTDEIVMSLVPATSIAGNTPQTTDTAQIASPVVLSADLNVVSILVEGTNANLTTDGNAHTITTTGGIQIEQGCTTTTSPCASPYAVDTSTGSAGNETTWVRTGMTTGQFLMENDDVSPFSCPPICSVNVNLSRSIFQAGAGGVMTGWNSGSALVVNNSKIVNGERGFSLSGVTNVTLNNLSSTGMSNTNAMVNFNAQVPTTCSISNLTQINATSNQPVITGTNDLSACSMMGNAILTDSAGVYAPNLIKANGATPSNSAVWSYNLGKNYNTTGVGGGAVNYGLSSCGGSSSHHCTIEYNIMDGFQNYIASYNDLVGNVCIFLPTGGLQGCMFSYTQQFVTSTNDVFVSNAASNGNIMFYMIGASSPTGGFVLTNDTFVGTLSTSSGNASESGPTWGENAAVSVADAMSNSILYGQNYNAGENMTSGDPNTFVTTGTDGVGVWNNNFFGALSGAWHPGSQIGTNVDDGTHHHPNALYADTTYNPGFVANYRSWAQCDAILGGAGSETNLFTQLFNRWNGSNPVNYTAQNIYNCMYAGYAPTEIRLAGRGAVKPHLIHTSIF